MMNNSGSDIMKITDKEIEVLLLTNFVEDEGNQIILNHMNVFACNIRLSFITYVSGDFSLLKIFFISVSELPLYVKNILNGQYRDVLNSELYFNLIKLYNHDNFVKLIHNSIEKEVTMHTFWLCAGTASMLYFIKCNWTGPQSDEDIEWLKGQKESALTDLSLHDECNTNIKKPELLYFSKIIFSNKILQSTYKSCIWWLFRANLLHQFVLNESSGVIFDETEQLINKIIDLPLLKNIHCKTLFYIETAQFYSYYRRIQSLEKYLEFAQETAKLSFSLEGALGKRTKYQKEDKAQLYLKTNLKKDQFPFRRCQNLPKSLDLNDDIRLERIEFSESIKNIQLGAVEEAIVLTK